MSEARTSCEEYGHLFEPCGSELCGGRCQWRICVDCGEEYEDD